MDVRLRIAIVCDSTADGLYPWARAVARLLEQIGAEVRLRTVRDVASDETVLLRGWAARRWEDPEGPEAEQASLDDLAWAEALLIGRSATQTWRLVTGVPERIPPIVFTMLHDILGNTLAEVAGVGPRTESGDGSRTESGEGSRTEAEEAILPPHHTDAARTADDTPAVVAPDPGGTPPARRLRLVGAGDDPGTVTADEQSGAVTDTGTEPDRSSVAWLFGPVRYAAAGLLLDAPPGAGTGTATIVAFPDRAARHAEWEPLPQ